MLLVMVMFIWDDVVLADGYVLVALSDDVALKLCFLNSALPCYLGSWVDMFMKYSICLLWIPRLMNDSQFPHHLRLTILELSLA
jgi:hypothetical protein